MRSIFLFTLFAAFCCCTYSKAQSWAQLGTGSNSLNCTAGTFNGGSLHSLVSDAQGNIYVAGFLFDSNSRNHVAKWNGSTWGIFGNAIDTGLIKLASVMCNGPDGSIYVAGSYQGGQPPRILKSSGAGWTNLCATSNPSSGGLFLTLCSDASGNIYTAGTFLNSTNRCYVAKWDGSTWSSLGTNPASGPGSTIRTVCADPTGNIYAAGMLKNSTGKYYVAKWDGSTWSELGVGVDTLNANGQIYSVISDNSGNIYAAGAFKNDSNYTYVAKWDGSSWTEMGGTQHMLKGIGSIYTLVSKDNHVYAAGDLTDSSFDYTYVFHWDGSKWSELGNLNATNSIYSLCADPAGNVYATGVFVNNQDYVYVAKYGDAIVGIPRNSLDAQHGISVWPNPSTGIFTVHPDKKRHSDSVLIEIISVSGQVVYSENKTNDTENGNYEIHLQNIASGIYTLRISSPNTSQTRKIIIER